jgi:O-antigen/teichoic acid export membrane protein
MASQPSLKKNYAYNIAYQLLAILVPFITTPYVSRVLGADRIGTYSFSLSVVTYFMLLSALGVQGYGSREIARLRDDKRECGKAFWELAFIVCVTTFVCTVAWVILAYNTPKQTAYFLGFTPMLISVAFDISWLYLGLEKMANVVLRNSVIKLLGVVMLFVLVRTPDDLMVYILINSSVQMVGNATMWINLPTLVGQPCLRFKKLAHHLEETTVYFIPALATTLYTVLDKTLIGLITSDTFQNGYYEQADKVVRMAMTLTFTSVNLVMGARLSYLFEKGAVDEAQMRAHNSLDFVLLIAFGFAFGIWSMADPFVALFFGGGYESVGGLLKIMCPLIVIVAVSNCLGSQYYTPSGRRGQSARYIVTGAGANLIVSLTLIPSLGMYGAAIGSMAAEVLISFLYLARCDGFVKPHVVWSCSWKRALAGSLGLACIIGCRCAFGLTAPVGLCMQAVIFCAAYSLGLLLLRDGMVLRIIDLVCDKIRQGKTHGGNCRRE